MSTATHHSVKSSDFLKISFLLDPFLFMGKMTILSFLKCCSSCDLFMYSSAHHVFFRGLADIILVFNGCTFPSEYI